ncbi:ParA family protein [Nocardia tengchongensis]|uniref:ParA family protein n=1 Tax=Nocardia tengchongensis TaxID=2055889 RepID=UPI003658B3A9
MGTEKPTRLVFLGIGGSTGKTTLATNLTCALANRGKQMRYIDGDQQGDGSRLMRYAEAPLVLADVLGDELVVEDPSAPHGFRAPQMREIELDLLRDTDDEAEATGGFGPGYAGGIAAEWMSRITVIPSGTGPKGSNLAESITKKERLAAGIGSRQIIAAFESIDAGLPPDQMPDIEILDLAGFKQTMSYIGMEWANGGGSRSGKSGIIAVATPDEKGMGTHLTAVFDMLDEVASLYPDLEVLAIIPTRTRNKNQGAFYAEMLTLLQTDEHHGHLVTPPVREAVYAGEAFRLREPLLAYAPGEGVTLDQEKVVDWLVEKGVVII